MIVTFDGHLIIQVMHYSKHHVLKQRLSNVVHVVEIQSIGYVAQLHQHLRRCCHRAHLVVVIDVSPIDPK
jgi:hypothetical protein